MKKHLFIALLFILSISMTAQQSNNKYENEWKKVEDIEKQNLPQSASHTVDEILQKALADKNTTQVIKALIYKNKYKKQIDSRGNNQLLSDLQNLISQTINGSEKALLHSMLAELYLDYFSNNRWNINQLSTLDGYIPEDIKEWSTNIFIDKIVENLDLSIKNSETLKKHTTREYNDIILLGEDTKDFYPTLYDFLMYRAIDIAENIAMLPSWDIQNITGKYKAEDLALPAGQYTKLSLSAGADKKQTALVYYQQYLKDLLSRNMTPTIIITDINKVIYMNNNLTAEQRIKAYEQLEKAYESNEYNALVIDKLVESFSQKFRYGKSPKEDNLIIYNWLQKGIQKYPNFNRIGLLKQRLHDLETPILEINGKTIYYPTEDIKMEITHKNLQSLKETQVLKLYTLNKEENAYSLVKEYTDKFISSETYNTDTAYITIPKIGVGKYCISNLPADSLNQTLANSNKDYYGYNSWDNKFEFTISKLMTFSRNSAPDTYEIVVVDRKYGNPVKNVTVEVYTIPRGNEKVRLLSTLKTNDKGIAIYVDKTPKNKNDYRYNIAQYKVKAGEDIYLDYNNLNFNDYKWNQNNSRIKEPIISIFTDRSIYRPGQTVYFKAIALTGDSKILPDEELTVELYNTNGDLVEEKEIITNEYGSISGEFILPSTGLTGQYRIEIDNESYYFNVEEYKRPTFEVTFDKVDKTYTFGEAVTVKGYARNFSGVNLQDATVNYTIMESPYSVWRPWSTNPIMFTQGDVSTKDDGSFEITFTPEERQGEGNWLYNQKILNYEIQAKVTDLNGETQVGNQNVIVGKVSMVVDIDIPQQIEKSTDYDINILAKNLQGENIETTGNYTIYKLDDNDSIQSKVKSGNFKTGKQEGLLKEIKTISSGKYRIEIKALDSKSNEVTVNKDFVLFSYNDKKPPIKTNEWLVKKNILFNKDKPAEIIFGVSDKDVYILYQLTSNEKTFEQRFVKLSNENKRFVIPYKEEYGNQIYMSLTFVKEGRLYNQNIPLTKDKEKASKELTIKLEVFRDKLRPGQKETWTLKVSDIEKKGISAEVLASMYDISLDKLYPYNQWELNYPPILGATFYPINYDYQYGVDKKLGIALPLDSKLFNIEPINLDTLNWFGYIYSNNNAKYIQYLNSNATTQVNDGKRIMLTGSVYKSDAIMIRGRGPLENSLQGRVAGVITQEAAPSPMEAGAIELFDKAEDKNDSGYNRTETTTPQIRQNFNETAFFFPQLRTNDKGETLISFTVPESNTSWRFRALAHDKDARVGTLEQMVVTRKELMVIPNLPRFVRQGDKTSISTKIANLSENAITGEVRIEFFDPATDKAIDLNIANQKQIFTVVKDASASASWTFDIPSGIELLGCRIIAQNETFSDGEQHVLAVLSNRMLVTESMPIDISNPGTTSLTFDKLYNNNSSSADNYRLTLEYASNPAWYAIQALPTMSNPSNENAVNWFASYYVNTLGSSIVRQYPKVSAMIQAWLKQGGSKETLISNLQKNEELKNVLLEETPWVLDAKDETDQMKRLSLLFDLNNTKQLTETATRKLKELMDNSDKAWAWYKGFYPNRAITQYILHGYAKLQEVGQVQYPEDVKTMQMDALRFIDKKIVEDFNNLKKYNKNWEKTTSVSTSQLEFAYVRSFYRDIPIGHEARAAERFYTDVASKNWTKLDLYEQSILVEVLKKNGEKALAEKIIKSIKEHAVKDKQGMYWPNNRNNVFMSMTAISTHTFLMDALKDNATADEMNLMKQWLLNQKRTQVWESTHATIDAISAILNTGSDWFTGENNPVTIIVGDKKVEPQNQELGTGYFKETWNKDEITNDMAKVTVTTTSNEPAFGAMYWQYYEDLNKVTAQKGDLNIEKQLFREEVSATGKGLTLVTENNPLKVGDKVIMRLTIRTNRDMEFVQLKDMRASCFEPQQVLSGTKWNGNLIYYQTTKDASTNFYFDNLPKGTYVLEYSVYVNRTGEYANGITTIQCLYAPEYTSHTQGIKITVKE